MAMRHDRQPQVIAGFQVYLKKFFSFYDLID
jgi:hypothetical protein